MQSSNRLTDKRNVNARLCIKTLFCRIIFAEKHHLNQYHIR